MKKWFLPIVAFLIILLPVYSIAQERAKNTHEEMFHKYTGLLSPEKVYLHTDKDVYFATDTIWFSGYVENASCISEFPESNYIYVELISDQLYRNEKSLSEYVEYRNDVVVRKKIKRDGSNFQGHIVVPEMNSTGRAVIRAYTYWMLNRSAEYMFYKELELTNPMKDKLVSAMAEKKIKNKDDYFRLGEVSPYDKLKEPKKNTNSRYDVQFLPESGNCITNENTVLYVKAIGEKGAGVKVFGEIMDSEDNVITSYVTDSLGFGRVVIPVLPSGKLKANVKDAFGYEKDGIRLQASQPRGVIINGSMRVNGDSSFTDKDRINFAITSSDEVLPLSLSAVIHNGTEFYYTKPIHARTETISLALKSLAPGIHSISVVDTEGNVYAQRPFIVLPTEKDELAIQVKKKGYKKRELVDVKIRVPKDMLDTLNNFSVSVTDIDLSENCEKTTMQSYMLLKSELKGYIENIDWYFNDSMSLSDRMYRADLLMQTHGWRYYDIEKIIQGKTDAHYFGREYMQTLFGKVMNPIGLTKKATVSFLAPTMKFTAMGQIDSGYFVLRDVSFPEETRFIVSAVGKNGKSKNHTPILLDDNYAQMYEYPKKGEKVTYTPTYKKIVESIYYGKDDGEHAMAFELNPIVVTSKIFTPKNSPSPISNYPIRREWFRDTIDMKPYSKSYNVASYVVATYSGVREYFGRSTEFIAVPKGNELTYGALIGPKITAGSWNGGRIMKPGRLGIVLIYLNGMEVTGQESVTWVLSLPLSQVESMIYVSGLAASPFQTAFAAAEQCPYPVLMVRTKPHVRSDQIPYNVSTGYPLGWQQPVKFYSPKYDTPEALKKKEKDNRITLYWNPAVKLDENGEATISFYTSDSDSKYRVEVEGRSAARQYHYAETIIERVKESVPARKK